jgi:hypothetical protein
MNKRAMAIGWIGLALLAAPLPADVIPPAMVDPRASLYTLEGSEEGPGDRPGAVIGRQRITLDEDTLQALSQLARAGDATLTLKLPLFGGQSVAVEFASDRASLTGEDWVVLTGRVPARPGDLVVLVVSDRHLGARLIVADAHYVIRQVAGQHYLLAIDPRRLPPEAPPVYPKASPGLGPGSSVPPHVHAAPSTSCQHTDAKQVTVLVLYTEAARQAAAAYASSADPDAAIKSAIYSALAAGNDALANSKSKTSFGLGIVPVRVPDYSEPGDGMRVFKQLYDPAHALHQFAAEQRTLTGANLVALVIEHFEYCGAAPVMLAWNTHPDQTAYSLVQRGCLGDGHFSLVHELAHSMGSAHDSEHAGVPGLFAFSFGFNSPGQKRSTIMAYECQDCERQKNFSNPQATFAGATNAAMASGTDCTNAPPGCRPTHNAESIDRAACQVVTWK